MIYRGIPNYESLGQLTGSLAVWQPWFHGREIDRKSRSFYHQPPEFLLRILEISPSDTRWTLAFAPLISFDPFWWIDGLPETQSAYISWLFIQLAGEPIATVANAQELLAWCTKISKKKGTWNLEHFFFWRSLADGGYPKTAGEWTIFPHVLW